MITDDKYIGCYKDEDSTAMSIRIVNDHLSVSSCLKLCRTHKYTFAGLENGTECHCGEDFAKFGMVDGVGCFLECSGNNQEACGGVNQLSVYSTCSRGFYGTSCDQTCPHTCTLSDTKICHLKTGKCCGDGTDPSNSFYCNFFDQEDCGSVDGDPRPDVGNMGTNAGTYFNLLATLTFPADALVTEIEYYTQTSGNTEYVSFWRHVDNSNYMIVAKLQLKPNATGRQLKMLMHNEKAFVQADDAVALHYPGSYLNNMIPYQDTKTSTITESDLHSFYNINVTGNNWKAGYTHSFGPRNGSNRTAAIKVRYKCIKGCASGKFGEDCSGTCMNCNNNSKCHFVDGTCPNGCKPGYTSYNCANLCDPGFYGSNCDNTCGSCLYDKMCHHISGNCEQGCNPGYQGHTCHDICNPGYIMDWRVRELVDLVRVIMFVIILTDSANMGVVMASKDTLVMKKI